MAPHTHSLALCFVAYVLMGCAPKGYSAEQERKREQATDCKVVKLSTSPDMTTCMVECAYHKGIPAGTVSAIPVPCEDWYGEKVTRE